MTDTHGALLRAFIMSEASPTGKWWVDVPVGLSIGATGEHTTVDAVCLTSRTQELPEAYPEHTGVSYVVHEGDADAGITKADTFRALRDSELFTDETAVLVAVTPGASSVGTVGELLAYRELLRADWDWTVEELLLVSDEDNDHVNHVCRKLSVRAMRVT